MRKMRFAWIVSGLLVLLAALSVTSIVYAGGWGVVTLDELPEQVAAGETYTLGMMARQHGRTPMTVKELRIEARHTATGQTVSFAARPEGQPGHYQAELVFPEAGQWEWKVESGFFPEWQPLPALNVVTAQDAGAHEAGAKNVPAANLVPNSAPEAAALGLAALALGFGLVLIARSHSRRPYVLAGLGMLGLCGVLVFGLVSTANAEARQAEVKQAQAAVESASPEATGKRLFLAKGCVVCHVNERAIANSAEYGVSMGPNLTTYRNDPDYLHTWLKDPAAIKVNAEMPNLELSKVEIEALISFINAED